jgi:hypothetical protein
MAGKNQSMVAHSNESRNAPNGYMERGNPAETPALLRAINNKDNGSHM